jgi:hypothetical protein
MLLTGMKMVGLIAATLHSKLGCCMLGRAAAVDQGNKEMRQDVDCTMNLCFDLRSKQRQHVETEAAG